MKPLFVLAMALGIAVSFSGCNGDRNPPQSKTSHTLTFADAGVSLVVGEGWQYDPLNAPHTLRPPTLQSPAGTIRVILLPRDLADLNSVADGLRKAFEQDRRSLKHSFRRQELRGVNGLRIISVSYDQNTEKGGRAVEMENHHFLVTNRDGRCVAINCLAEAGTDAASLGRMVTGGLSVSERNFAASP